MTNTNNSTTSISTEPIDDYNGLVPSNFLSTCNGNLIKAQKMYNKMLLWRKLNHVDDIFEMPQQHFHTVLQYYPHAIHGYSLDGCAVVYEILGKGKLSELKKSVDMEQLVWHFALIKILIKHHHYHHQQI